MQYSGLFLLSMLIFGPKSCFLGSRQLFRQKKSKYSLNSRYQRSCMPFMWNWVCSGPRFEIPYSTSSWTFWPIRLWILWFQDGRSNETGYSRERSSYKIYQISVPGLQFFLLSKRRTAGSRQNRASKIKTSWMSVLSWSLCSKKRIGKT